MSGSRKWNELPRCLDPRSSYDKMKDPWRYYKQCGTRRGYGGPKWNVMWCERDDMRYVSAKHMRCNWTKREVTSYRNDKKRNVER